MAVELGVTENQTVPAWLLGGDQLLAVTELELAGEQRVRLDTAGAREATGLSIQSE